MIGATLDNYRILEKLGAGGQGEVYKAVDTKLGRTVVIKILSPELTAREVNLKRFERRGRTERTRDENALDRLMPIVYDELRRLAHGLTRGF